MDTRIDDPRITAYGLFLEAQRALAAALARETPEATGGMRQQDFDLVIRLARSPERRLRMTDLAAQSGLSPSGLTRAIDRLARDGIVERAGCPEDARGSYAVLTAIGADWVMCSLEQQLRSLDEHFFGVLSEREVSQLSAITRKLRDHHNPAAAQVSSP